MCGLWFKKTEVNKKLTLKMLYVVKTHLENRHVPISFALPKERFQNRAEAVKICKLCYNLAIAEYQLIEAECNLARIQGIPTSVDQLLLQSCKGPGFESKGLIDPFLYQWRVMVYLDTVTNIPGKFLFKKREYWIQYKILGYSLSFPLDLGVDKVVKKRRGGTMGPTGRRASHSTAAFTLKGSECEMYDKRVLKINKLRTFYLFSTSCNLDDFLKKEMVNIRMTDGDDWENYVAYGHANLFNDCTYSDYTSVCLCYTKYVLLFLPNKLSNYIKLKV